MTDPLLEVVVLHAADAEAAQEGGADRLEVVGSHADGLSPEPAVVSSVVRACELPVRVVLRLNTGLSTTGAELTRLVALAESYLAAGAEGVACGFLDHDLEVDVEVARVVAEAVAPAPWTFHRAIDATLDRRRSWRRVVELPGIDAVLSAGSPLGVQEGLDELTSAAADPRVCALTMAGGGLRPEHVPWLVRAGISSFHVGAAVRPGGSWSKAYVDTGYVRSWRLLLDDEMAAYAPPPEPSR
ncbi:MAG: copper homeostasis protein CutC [Nocardioidaceae bacterium]|jgi:copper homeostasis protein|nr:copper homeostasis protein CutC [Nocardioidaceae bacterium]